MSDIVINNRKYSWADVNAIIFGRLLVGISAISYKHKEEIKGVKGSGKKDIGYVQGNYEADGSITLHMDEVQSIRRKLLPGQNLMSIKPFKVVVAFINEDNLPVKHSFNAKFMNDGVEVDNGGTKAIDSKIDLYIPDLNLNG